MSDRDKGIACLCAALLAAWTALLAVLIIRHVDTAAARNKAPITINVRVDSPAKAAQTVKALLPALEDRRLR